MKFEPGQIIDERYRIVSLLGSGAFGAVYLVDELLLNRQVVLKILNRLQANTDDAALKRFEREARILSNMVHANIVRLHRFSHLTDGTPFLELEYVQGESLRARLEREQTLSCSQAIEIAQQLCLALKYAYGFGVIHRDLKPENILLYSEGINQKLVKVVDFGLSKHSESVGPDGKVTTTLTEPGALIGTPEYMSPEQCLGQEMNWQCDLYALGCVLFEMIVGVTPFRGDSLVAIIHNHISMPTQKIHELSGGERFPLALDRIIENCCRKTPADRYASYDQLYDDLNQDAIISNQARFGARLRKSKYRIAAGTLTLIGVFIVAIVASCWYWNDTLRRREDDVFSALGLIKTSLNSGSTDEAERILQKALHNPECKGRFRTKLAIDCMKLFQIQEHLGPARDCAIAALSSLVDEVKVCLAEGKSVDAVTLEDLDSVCAFLLKNTSGHSQWSKIYSIVSTRTMVPTNQQILAEQKSVNMQKLWVASALDKGEMLDRKIADEAAGGILAVLDLREKDPKLDVDTAYYFQLAQKLTDRFNLQFKKCELHLMLSRYAQNAGDKATAKRESRLALDTFHRLEASDAPGLDALRSLCISRMNECNSN